MRPADGDRRGKNCDRVIDDFRISPIEARGGSDRYPPVLVELVLLVEDMVEDSVGIEFPEAAVLSAVQRACLLHGQALRGSSS